MEIDRKKKVLFIAPECYGYERAVQEALSRKGFDVCFISESIDQINLINRILVRYFPKSKPTCALIQKYYKKLAAVDNDYVLIIRGGEIPVYILEMLRSKNRDAKFIYYNWDAVALNPKAKELAPYFDQVITMDMCDAKEYGWKYVPLYTTCDHIDESSRLYDISFIGNMHTKRAVIVQRIKEIQKQHPGGLSIFTYLQMSFLSYLKQKYIAKNKVFADVSRKDLRFKKMTWDETKRIYENTRVMADYTAPGQNGFNSRTVESLACRCKLITNNANVKEADFFDPNNIWVYEEDHFDVPEWFLKADYRELSPEIYDQYTVEEWVRNVIGDQEI